MRKLKKTAKAIADKWTDVHPTKRTYHKRRKAMDELMAHPQRGPLAVYVNMELHAICEDDDRPISDFADRFAERMGA